MLNNYILFSIFFIGLSSTIIGCGEINKKQAPLWAGIRLDTSIDTARLAKDLIAVDSLGIRDYAIELIVYTDTITGFPKISRTSLTQLSRVLPIFRGRALTLVLTRVATRPIWIAGKIRPTQWFERYCEELNELAQRTKSAYVWRVALGNDFQPLEQYANEWALLAQSNIFDKKVRLTYITNLDRVQSFGAWKAFDEIGIHYQTASDLSEKSFARRWNPIVSEVAYKLNKPVFIANANLIDKNKKTQLEYRLSFWQENVALSGVVLNSIFDRPALIDTVRYFGCAQDTALLNYIKAYTRIRSTTH